MIGYLVPVGTAKCEIRFNLFAERNKIIIIMSQVDFSLVTKEIHQRELFLKKCKIL